jgi:hypothetical protein
MRTFLWISIVLALSGCSSARVLVKDCQDLAGMGDQKNCELIRKL